MKADSIFTNLVPADYSMLATCVAGRDLVFESAAENLDIKIDLHTRIAQSLKKGAVACTGSSGLSIRRLAECYPENLRSQFFGVHIFNPRISSIFVNLLHPNIVIWRCTLNLKSI